MGLAKDTMKKISDVSEAKLNFKPFSKQDWSAYAGAEKFDSGDEPRVGYMGDNVIILDATGIEVAANDGDSYAMPWQRPASSPASALHLFNKLKLKNLDKSTLTSAGFKKR